MTKYIIAVLAVVAALLGSWGAFGHYRNTKLQADVVAQQTTIQNQNVAILAHQAREKRDTLVLKDMAARQAALIIKQKETTHALSKALEDAPDWASTPLPTGIAEWVRD
jgi:hypothetical protein